MTHNSINHLLADNLIFFIPIVVKYIQNEDPSNERQVLTVRTIGTYITTY